MAAEVRTFAAVIPAGTPQAAPVTIELAMPVRVVTAIRWRVPPGPAGVMGWALGAAGVRVIPWGAGQWIVADDEADEWTLTDQITSGAWELQGYNTGAYDHTVYLTFLLGLVGATSSGLVTPVAVAP